MSETQEKRTGGSTSGNTINNDVKNQTSNPAQNNMQTGMSGDAKNPSEKQTTDKSGNTSSGGTTDTKEMLQQAKETAGQAYEKVTEQASSQIATQKDNLARGLSSVADGIRQMGENLRGGEQQTPIAGITAKYGDSLARQVEQVSGYLEKKDFRELFKDVEVFARRNPAVFIGGAFALGIAAARFLKSSNPNQALMRRPRREREGIYIPDKSEGVYLPEDLSKKVGLTDTPKTFNTGLSGTSDKTFGGKSSTGDKTSTGDTKTGGTTSTTDRTSTDAFSTNKGG
ncbi:MAG TPA: hypothetical protein VNI60_11700 [Pyrinomonadaceae bacterium]|nr:hypothetical protein [Pyrinomonadaceae bacterium]